MVCLFKWNWWIFCGVQAGALFLRSFQAKYNERCDNLMMWALFSFDGAGTFFNASFGVFSPPPTRMRSNRSKLWSQKRLTPQDHTGIGHSETRKDRRLSVLCYPYWFLFNQRNTGGWQSGFFTLDPCSDLSCFSVFQWHLAFMFQVYVWNLSELEATWALLRWAARRSQPFSSARIKFSLVCWMRDLTSICKTPTAIPCSYWPPNKVNFRFKEKLKNKDKEGQNTGFCVYEENDAQVWNNKDLIRRCWRYSVTADSKGLRCQRSRFQRQERATLLCQGT